MKRSGLVMVCLVLGACGGTETPSSECTPGVSIPCTGPAGCAGGQVCLADGTGYGICDCRRPDGGGGHAVDGAADGFTEGGASGVDGGGDDEVTADAAADTDAAVGPVCTSCPDDGNLCTYDGCEDGRCIHPPVEDGTGCGLGMCYDGQCCTGCWDGSDCRGGMEAREVWQCGSLGRECLDCNDRNPCTLDLCDIGTLAYRCTHDERDGRACPSGVCDGDVCTPCGGEDELCCADGLCDGPGLQCNLAAATPRCEACGHVGEPCCLGEEVRCPEAGVDCVNQRCTACGGFGEPCCYDEMQRCATGLGCTTDRVCSCGGSGEVCCVGGVPGTPYLQCQPPWSCDSTYGRCCFSGC